VAERAAKDLGAVVLPTLYAGTETLRPPGTGPQGLANLGFDDSERIVGMDFPANSVRSLYFEESAFGLTVREVVRGLKANEFRLIVLLNGHGAINHQQTLRRVAVEESEPGQKVLYHPAWLPPLPPQSGPGHAEKWETSIVLALERDSVRIDRLPGKEVPLKYMDHGIVDGMAFDGSPQAAFELPAQADPRFSSAEEGSTIIRDEVEATVSVVRRELKLLGL
jgi:creatinine amidohydrolase